MMMSARTSPAVGTMPNSNIKTRPHVRARPVPSSSQQQQRPISSSYSSRSSSYGSYTKKSSIMTSSSSRSSSSYQRMEKSVNFAPAVRVHLTVGRWELSPEEHYRVWTSSQDTKKSQDGILDSVRHMRQFVMADGELSPDCESTLLANNRTARGVEHMRSRTSIAARRPSPQPIVWLGPQVRARPAPEFRTRPGGCLLCPQIQPNRGFAPRDLTEIAPKDWKLRTIRRRSSRRHRFRRRGRSGS